jgi:signal transduction histidine kinase
MTHILMNLLSNAIKYSEEGKSILFEISNNDEEVTITIKDEGIGIPEEDQKHLFERFFRAANSANTQGTGLGLHIVKQYVTLMGGEVSCTSTLGMGTSVTLSLPLKLEVDEESIDN